MPFLIEHITEVVFSILVILLLANGAIVALAVTRRQRRERLFQRMDELRERYGPVIAALLAGKLDYSQGLEALKEISGLDRDYFLEQLCLARLPTAAQVPNLRRLTEDLGLVNIWRRQLAGQFDIATLRGALARPEGLFQLVGRLRFLLRAKSADNLGIVRHQPSWPLLLRALDDPHPDVQVAALRSLAAIGDPESFPGLVERLHAVVLNPALRLSLRSIKTALLAFPLTQAHALVPSLTHKHRRIRFFATDIIREMVEREAGEDEEFILEPKIFPEELRELFLTRLCFDDNPDVRARTAPVIARLADPRSAAVLLTLLEDSQWFVRLHALRAMAAPKFQPQAAAIARHLTDPNWMVREAAAKALLIFGQLGLRQLYENFLSSPDRYSREQIADEMQRSGLIPDLLKQYLEAGEGQEKRVMEQLAQMGKTSYLLALLARAPEQGWRKKFLEDFGRYPDEQIRNWVKRLATGEADPELRALAQAALEPGAP
jgi:HEAT repeat protein